MLDQRNGISKEKSKVVSSLHDKCSGEELRLHFQKLWFYYTSTEISVKYLNCTDLSLHLCQLISLFCCSWPGEERSCSCHAQFILGVRVPPPRCSGRLQAAQKLQPLCCTSSEAQPIPDVHTSPAACSLSHSSASQKNHICSGSSNIEVTRGCSSMMSPLHSRVTAIKELTSSFHFFIALPGTMQLWWQ